VSASATRRSLASLLPGRALAVGTLGTIGLNVSSFVLNLVLTLILSRTLGADGYGAFAFAFAWSLLLASLANLGLSALTVRYVAQYLERERWGLLRGLVSRLNQVVGATSLVAIALAAAIGTAVLPHDGELYVPFLVGLLVVPLITLTTQRQCVMQGLHRVILGRMPETLVAPAFLVLMVAGVVALGAELTAEKTLWLRVVAQAVSFVLGLLLLLRALPPAVRTAKAEFEHRAWLRTGLPLFFMGVVIAANAQVGTIVLGVTGGPAEAGIFAVATRASMFVGFVMLAATYPLMPTFARIRALGDESLYHATAVRATRSVVLATAPIVVGLFILAEPILALFGSEFGAGATAVRVLVIGETAKLLVGVLAVGLVMSGEERWMTKAIGAGAILNIGLAVALAPSFGVNGAAVAAAVSATVSSALVIVRARRLQGFRLTNFVWRRHGGCD
jgi:O-antigen/teichoic acid export membrane protein